MLLKKMVRSLFVVGILVVLSSSSIFSMPNFARKYGMACSACHNPIPRLNDFGFKFRAAGFRLPEEIGKDASSENLGSYFAGRVQAKWNVNSSDNGAGTTTSSNQFTLHEITLYPASGSFGKYLSSLFEMSFASGAVAELENAYVRATFGDENSYFTIRAGVFHPFEGYGASDRPLGIARPLFQTTKATPGQFKSWGYDQAGVEFGYSLNNTFVRASVFNGILGSGEPAQGGDLKKTPGDPSYNSKDIQLTVTQLLNKDGAGLSGYFYLGNVDLTNGATTYQDKFNRYAVYGSYPVGNILALAGYQGGSDGKFDVTTKKADGTFANNGYYGELNYKIEDPFWLGLRYSQFDPSTSVSDNSVTAVTGIVHYSLEDGLFFVAEYNLKQTAKGASVTQKNNDFELRMVYIY